MVPSTKSLAPLSQIGSLLLCIGQSVPAISRKSSKATFLSLVFSLLSCCSRVCLSANAKPSNSYHSL